MAVSREPTNTTRVDGLLERSAQLAALDEHLGAVRAHGRGRLVLIAGEAGIGKTTLAAGVLRGAARRSRVLWGACDALYTPRPLGPFARHGAGGRRRARGGRRGGRHARACSSQRWRGELAGGLRASWCSRICTGPTRPRSTSCACSPVASSRSRRWSLATYRDDELDRAHPLRIVLGELPRHATDRIALAPLSPGAVAALAGSADVDAGELHRRTAGNPFFVTEVLATADDAIPETVRDAVLARVARLDDGARRCSTPSRSSRSAPSCGCWRRWPTATWRRSTRAWRPASCAPTATPSASATRSPASRSRRRCRRTARLALHRKALAALAAHGARPDPARLAHHAEAADDADAVLRHAPDAGEAAAALGSHREAAAQFARALRYADGLAPERRAELLERRSYECYLTNDFVGAIEARRRALRRAPRGRRPAGRGRRPPLALAADLVLRRQREPPRRRHAWRSSCSSRSPPAASSRWPTATWRSCGCSANDQPAATSWGERAIELAERLGETEIVVHALNNVGRRGAAQGAGRRQGQARAQPRAGARRRPRGARRPRVHQPRRRQRRAPRLRDRRPQSRRRDRLLRRARPRRVAGLHDRMAGALGARSRALGRRRREPRPLVPGAQRRRAEPHHPARRSSGGCARAAATPTRGRRSTRRASSPAAPASCSAWRRWPARAPRRAGSPVRPGEIAGETDATLALALELRDAMGAGRAVPLAPARRPRRRDRARCGRRAVPARARGRRARRPPTRWTAIGCPYEAALARGHAGDAGRPAPRARRAPGASARGRPPAASPAPCASAACATCGGARAPRRARTRPG